MAHCNFFKKMLIGGVCIFALKPALLMAADIALDTQSQASLTSAVDVSNETAQCTKSQLTQEKFLETLHAIAIHGELADIPFLEKTLGVKFASHDDGKNGTMYDVTSYRGVPITISVKRYDIPDQKDWISKPVPKTLAMMTFHFGEQSRICGYVVKDKFDKKFAEYKIKKISDALDPNSIVGSAIVMGDISRADAAYAVYAGKDANPTDEKYSSFNSIEYKVTELTNKALAEIDIKQIVTK